MNGSQDLVVLGAGPAGLAAAWRAARRGLKVTLLERADRVGGLAGSFEVAGQRVDHGAHATDGCGSRDGGSDSRCKQAS
jgi:phytoene dehydrogenase-like protein